MKVTTHRELNALVAETVLGWKRHPMHGYWLKPSPIPPCWLSASLPSRPAGSRSSGARHPDWEAGNQG